jgi:LacI family transcriptional regulator
MALDDTVVKDPGDNVVIARAGRIECRRPVAREASVPYVADTLLEEAIEDMPRGSPARARIAGRPTVRDVALVAGVSFKTVARVINGEPGVRPATAERVTAAVRQLGFRRNVIAASLKRGVSQDTIGLVIDDVSNPFFATLTRSIEDVAWARGIQLIIASSDHDPGRERAIIDSLVAQRVGGLLVVPVGRDHRYLAREMRMGTAVVFLDRPQGHLRADTLVVQNHEGARMAVRHLITHGHERVAVLAQSPSIYTMAERLRGYRAALAEAGLTPTESLLRYPVADVENARAAAADLLGSRAAPTAFFGSNNQMTVGIVKAVSAQGQRIAIVGFDDFELAEALSPPISVVRPDVRELGRLGCELLLQRMDGWTGTPQKIVLPVELVPRGSGELRPER